MIESGLWHDLGPTFAGDIGACASPPGARTLPPSTAAARQSVRSKVSAALRRWHRTPAEERRHTAPVMEIEAAKRGIADTSATLAARRR
jgi:hypothetical protein